MCTQICKLLKCFYIINIVVQPYKEGECCWLQVTMEPLYPTSATTSVVWRQLHGARVTPGWWTVPVPTIRNHFHIFIISIVHEAIFNSKAVLLFTL